MARGRGQGWEEKTQHPVFAKYLQNQGFEFFHELPINIDIFRNHAKRSRIDFVVVHPQCLELVECKNGFHPSYQLAQAIGVLLVYRSLILIESNYPEIIPKRNIIRLSICTINGYKSEKGNDEWTDAHDKLIRNIEKTIHENIGVYLVQPKSEKKATKQYWNNIKCQKVVVHK